MSPFPKSDDTFAGMVKVCIVLMVACLGLWGCARKPESKLTANERLKNLEARFQKLEQDYRAAALARDQARRQVTAMEEENAKLQKDLTDKVALIKEQEQLKVQLASLLSEKDQLTKALVVRTSERDDLKQQMNQRLNEREMLQNRCEKLRKGLQQLLSQDDGRSPGNPSNSAAIRAVTVGRGS